MSLILREANSSAFRVVGWAYVHGFMKGEALESQTLFKDIIIFLLRYTKTSFPVVVLITALNIHRIRKMPRLIRAAFAAAGGGG